MQHKAWRDGPLLSLTPLSRRGGSIGGPLLIANLCLCLGLARGGHLDVSRASGALGLLGLIGLRLRCGLRLRKGIGRANKRPRTRSVNRLALHGACRRRPSAPKRLALGSVLRLKRQSHHIVGGGMRASEREGASQAAAPLPEHLNLGEHSAHGALGLSRGPPMRGVLQHPRSSRRFARVTGRTAPQAASATHQAKLSS